MNRVPIRLRVAGGFAVAMALVLAATGVYLYISLGNDLSTALDQELRLRAQDLTAVVHRPGTPLADQSRGRFIEPGESFAQLVGPGGRVIDATRPLGRTPLLQADQIRAALEGPVFLTRPAVPGLNESARLLATAVNHDGSGAVLVVGATRENRAEALRSLRDKLLIAGPIALLLATGIGYLLAGSGLRAVEAMRRRAAGISAEKPLERLPVPKTGDELERLGTTLNEMLDRLEAAIERERGFVAEAGHELRSPLALLRAELDFALHHAETTDELRNAVREAGAETDRLVLLAGDLLVIAGSDQGKLPLRNERIPVRKLFESVRNRFVWRAEEGSRSLSVLAGDDLLVTGDRLRLEQALANLVENALRYGAGEVRLEAHPWEGAVELHVCDAGTGFSGQFLPRAFDRFSRAEGSRTSGGAGLGLAIVEAIARAHGGSAHAANRPEGTDVWISLPPDQAHT